MAYVVGLTGGIGSGKSTISGYFAELGVPVIDADVIARRLVEKDTPLLADIVACFGSGILTEQGELNRAKLRQIVFADSDKRNLLNQLLHPAIRTEMLNRIAEINFPYVLWVVPLLIENQLTDFCQRILVIDVDPNIQLKRAVARDKSRVETIKNIIKSQVSREVRLSYADDVIENNHRLSDNEQQLKQQVQTLHQSYLTLANKKERENDCR